MTRKTEPPLYINMDFGEALGRFAQTKPAEVEELVKRAKQAKAAEAAKKAAPAKPKRRPRASEGT